MLKNLSGLANDPASSLGGKLEAARELLEQSLRLRRGLGHRIGVADSLNNLGDVMSASYERGGALQHYQQALTVALEIQALPLAMEVFVGIADLLRHRKEAAASVSLLALARHHDASWWEAKRRAASNLSKLEPELSRTDFARAAAQGRAMSCSEAATRFAFL